MHEKTKYIEIDCHIIRKKVNNDPLKLLSKSIKVQLANIFEIPDFKKICSMMRMFNLCSEVKGGSLVIVRFWTFCFSLLSTS